MYFASMNAKHGPIILVDDDPNDCDVIVAAFRELGVPNELRVFAAATDAMDYLLHTDERPLVILCDIRLPVLNGLSFRRKISETERIRRKSIPFVFFTGAVSQELVNEAYDLTVQGFYQKPSSYAELKRQLEHIYLYWRDCLHPNALTGVQ